MFYKLRTTCTVAMIMLTLLANAQENKLGIGDKMPDVAMTNLTNYKASTLHLSDFKGKSLIIDFWNPYCLSCIKSFPHIDSLQNVFGDRLQFILVNREDKSTTDNFFLRKKMVHKPGVPMASGNTSLIQLFPKDGYPYSIWIDSSGIIRYMAHAYNITDGHIRDFLNAKRLNINNASARVFYGSIPEYKGDELVRNLGYFSCITHCIQQLNIGYADLKNFNDSLVEISSNCSSVLGLYKKAYSQKGIFNFDEPGTVQMQVLDKNKYVRPEDPGLLDEWNKKYSYNYTLFLPVSMKDQAYKIMQQDLERYFGLKATIVENNAVTGPNFILVLKE